MSEQTAYIVTKGSYSDYGIVAVFLDRSIAQAFVDSHNRTESPYYHAAIEEWDVQTEAPHPITVHRFSVNGDDLQTWDTVEWSHEFEGIGEATASIRGGKVWAYGQGRTPEEARKATWDAVARLRADQAGIA